MLNMVKNTLNALRGLKLINYDKNMYKLQNQDFHLASSKLYAAIQIVTRVLLVVYAIFYQQITFFQIPEIFFIGFINDVITISYVLALLSILQFFIDLIFKNKTLRQIANIIMFLILSSLIFLGFIAELMFWDEFGTRFNFIAVDYIIYTHEIIGTLRQEMPLWLILPIIFGGSLISLKYFLSHKKTAISGQHNLLYFIFSVLICTSAFLFYNPNKINLSSNVYVQELNKNGIYQLFAAFYYNSLDYMQFYPTIDKEKAFSIIQHNILQPNQTLINGDNEIERINRPIKNKTKNKKLNVVLIIIESMSSEFMGQFGNQQNITPFLDSLADQSIFFTNYYATGTRTVRGLEAILLSTPPSPGASVIRKPEHNNFFTAGDVFRDHGYDVSFIYGGYGYFDNMLGFFTNNNYKFIDRSDFDSNEITFANIWGVADENLFDKSIQYFDTKKDKPFFSIILTTSNHRPYTFPQGKIDLPSGSNRAAAVKYTDYAIKSFIEKARSKPWFRDTIFVVTADHCASSAGKIHLPIQKYHIPLMIYAPGLLQPKKENSLCSQIDVMPTVLGILNFEYKTQFFGRDVLNYPTDRSFISTYQMLGYIRDKDMVVLAPRKEPIFYEIKDKTQFISKDRMQDLLDEAIAFYQTSYMTYY